MGRGLVVAACVVALASGADPKKPHFHGPTRAPFAPSDSIAPELGSGDLAKLEEGGIVTVQSSQGSNGGGCAVEVIRAPPDVVWSQLLTFETYPTKVPKVKSCANYEVTKEAGAELMKTRYVVGVVPGLSMEYYLRHVFHPDENALTWTLDYERESDIDDCHGIWKVVPHPERPDWSRVEYAADLKLRGGCPQFVIDLLTKKALVDACTWLKVESEKQHAEELASGASPVRRFAAQRNGGGGPPVQLVARAVSGAPKHLYEACEATARFAGDLVEDTLADLEQGVVDFGNFALRSATETLHRIPGFRETMAKPLLQLNRAYNDVPGPDPRPVHVAELAPKTQRRRLWLRRPAPPKRE